MKTKMNFSDIAGMLERDEMREIVGGSGNEIGGGGGFVILKGTALGGSGPAFGGGANFNYSGGMNGGGLSSNFGSSSSNYGGSSYGSSGSSGSGYGSGTSSSSSSVKQSDYDYYASLYGVGPKTPQNSATYGVYNPNGVNLNSGSSYGGYNPEDGVIIIKNPKTYTPVSGSSIDLNSMFNPNINYNPYTGSFMASTGNSNTLDEQQRKPLTDCVFQSMAYLAGIYGNHNLNFNSMMNNYNSLYSGAISAGIIKPASGGVDAALLPSFADQYFNRVSGITTTAQLSSFIAKGGNNFAIGTYSVGSSTSHAFVITGMTPTQFTGWDEQNQRPVSVDKNLITNFVAINGVCP